MVIDNVIVAQFVGAGILVLNGVVIFYMKGTRDQMVKMNGSIQNTRETYTPKKDTNTLQENIRESLKRMHVRVDEIFTLLVGISKGK